MALPPYLDLAAELRDPERAAAAILPVAYDGTSTWKKGADRGPAAILEASTQVELYDVETATEPYRHGIATLEEVRFDGPPEALADIVEQQVAAILDRAQLPVILGGEHSVSIGAIRAAAAAFADLSVLQIDAHADTRESYDGSSHNHACVMARAREVCPIVQVGIRSLDAAELEQLDTERVVWAHDLDRDDKWIERAVSLLGPRVYVTIDLDAFDPSLMPATGTPEPGGMTWQQVTGLLARVVASRRVVGFDVVELLPQPGDHACDFLAAKLIHRFLAMILARS
jgi:agmatinase